MIYSVFRFGNKGQKWVKKSVILGVNGLRQWGKLTDRRFRSLVAWRRRPHKTSRPRKPELHARALTFPADVIKLRGTFGAQLNSVVVARALNNLQEIKDFIFWWTPPQS